jgi:hypothetical protein
MRRLTQISVVVAFLASLTTGAYHYGALRLPHYGPFMRGWQYPYVAAWWLSLVVFPFLYLRRVKETQGSPRRVIALLSVAVPAWALGDFSILLSPVCAWGVIGLFCFFSRPQRSL